MEEQAVGGDAGRATLPTVVDPICQDDDYQLPGRVHPETRAGKTGVAEARFTYSRGLLPFLGSELDSEPSTLNRSRRSR